ncbi:MAG: penicillin-binding protein [Acidobacteria bacterium]|nr:penicillin-binding protein [Acidobacteriota bacterium]
MLVIALAPAVLAGAARKDGTKQPPGKVARNAKQPVRKNVAQTKAARPKAAVKKNAIAVQAGPRRTTTTARAKAPVRKRYSNGYWTEPTFADSADGDRLDGEDPVVRRAAIEALGPYNGSVVVVDPTSGRVLSIVNQRVAFKDGFTPCSTIKIVAAMAGIIEGFIERDTKLRVGRRASMDLTYALAHSNNPYFAVIGNRLGFDRVTYYAKLFGLGEKAGLNISEERAGTWPDVPPKFGGVGMMTSFGSGINLTPLQLASIVSMIANGGTLYYMQYPRTPEESAGFTPVIKRQLTLERVLPEVLPGMQGAVEYGTARRAHYDPSQPIFGKTGTCTHSDQRTHLGWFGSFNEIAGRKLAVVVLLTGGRPINGPVASGVAGNVYKNLAHQRYFGAEPATLTGSAAASFSGDQALQ